mmetsp:Transcript_57818/g.122615  ORF Transcript_57818/g.122615 Transcript_57818/m.122615 type:complete len:266 (+) Transcript_57818:232-1029(+)
MAHKIEVSTLGLGRNFFFRSSITARLLGLLLVTSFRQLELLVILGQPSVLGQLFHLRLEVLHILRKSPRSILHRLTPVKPADELAPSILLLPPPYEASDRGHNEGHQEDPEDDESHGTLLEQFRQSQQEEGDHEEDDDDVNRGDGAASPRPLPEGAGSLEGHLAHEGDGVPDGNTGEVEEEVGEGHLEGLDLSGDKGGEEAGDGGTDVGSESEGEHLFQLNHAKTNDGSQHARGDARTLHQHGDGRADDDGEHSRHLGGLVNDPG